MNKFFLVISAITFLALFASVAVAISLPNPLCPSGGNATQCVNDLPTLVVKITNYIASVIAVLATLMFVWGGMLFVSSGGRPEQITKAKKALLVTAVGAAIALAAKGLATVIAEVINTPTP